MSNFFKKIKFELCKFKLPNKIITDRSIKIHKKKIEKIEKNFSKKLRFYSPKDFKDLYKKHYKSCHIWGSGGSADFTKNYIKNRDDFFHIGFGFSCLLEIEYNFYLIENASNKNLKLIESQNKALSKFINKNKTTLVFKNLWQKKNDPNVAYENYKEDAFFIRDLIVPHYNMSDFAINNTIDKLLINDPNYFREACSSVITSIIFAKFLGFKEIVLHGIDLTGNYFFDKAYYKENSTDCIPPHVENIYDKDWRSNKDKHPTANCLEVMLPKLRDKLKLDYNINLLSASKKSGSSKYLNTFFND
ncbi:MAG: hypothetical protein CMK44_00130 [Porticoccus sp.]|nr:hypothetical protein [Porticoccus sp.]